MTASAADASEAHVAIGDRVGGDYRITRLIGRGGMGFVAEAIHGTHGGKVAVKVLHPRHLENKEAVARFMYEGRAASQVRGEHAVRVHDMGIDEGRPYLVMELLEGEDLSALLERGPVGVEGAALYILQACEGMAEVHSHGIVHRDLKPSNLFLTWRPDRTPLIKVLDFGIAKGMTVDPGAPALTQTLVGLGTPLYMSPEQIRSSREVDARADVWSLGTIFYELIVGQPAFGGATLTQITAQVLESNPPLPSTFDPSIPRAVDDIVQAALAKNPDARLVDVAALASMLEPLAGLAGVGAAARCARILGGAMRSDMMSSPPVARDDPAGGTQRFDRQKRTRRLRAAVAVVGVAAVVLVAAAISVYRDGPRAASPQLAKRGIEMQATRAALFAATKLDAEREADTDTAAPAVVLGGDADSATATASGALPANSASWNADARRAAGSPSTVAASTEAPTPPPPSTATGKAWNPYDERN